MSDRQESGNYSETLNGLLDDLKDLTHSLEYFEEFEAKKDHIGQRISIDSILYRVDKVCKRIVNNHQMAFPQAEINKLLGESIFKDKKVSKFSSKEIREILDFPMESLRKFALSEILNQSIIN